MQNPVAHTISGHTFWIYPERCLWWEQENTLIVADTHLGKTGHFRKSGIAIPQEIFKADLQRLMSMITLSGAERLLVIGDFSHSHHNRELDLFLKWRKDLPSLHIDLVRGNHDILEDTWYEEASITVHENGLRQNGFLFLHDPSERDPYKEESIHYTFSAHVHPAITLRGAGKQSLRFPCFYFSNNLGILPAFSRFTGTYSVKPEKGDTVYAITPAEIIRLA